MKIMNLLFLLSVFLSNVAYGLDGCEYDYIVSELRKNCTGINAELQEIKNYETANTIVSGTGTVTAGGALYAGIKKKDIDKKAEELAKKMDNIENMSDAEFVSFLKETAQYQESKIFLTQEKSDLEAKSKNLGNIRTGLMVGNTATAVAGTIISNKNKKDSDSIKDSIQQCLDTIKNNEQKIGQSMIDCGRDQYEKLKKAVSECKMLSTENMEKVSKHSNISTIVSGVNIGTGTAGVITSALANQNKYDKKTKNMNTAANVLSGASMAASGVSTVFNATTFRSINNNLKASELCEYAISKL